MPDPAEIGNAFVEQFTKPDVISASPGIAPIHKDEPVPGLASKHEFAGDPAIDAYSSHVGDLYQQRLEKLGMGEQAKTYRPHVEEAVRGHVQNHVVNTFAQRIKDEGYVGRGSIDYIGRRVMPFYGMASDTGKALDMNDAAKAIQNRQADARPYIAVAHQQAQAQRDQEEGKNGIGGQLFDFASQGPATIAEWMLSGGTAPAVAGRGLLKQAAGQAIGTIARQSPTMGLRVGAGMARDMARQPVQGESGLEFKDGESFGRALAGNIASDVVERGMFGAIDPLQLRAGKGYVEKTINSLMNIPKLMAAGELSQDAKAAIERAPQGGGVWRLANAKTPAERAKAIQDLLVEGAGFGLFEAGMHGYSKYSTGKKENSKLPQIGVEEIIKDTAAKELANVQPPPANGEPQAAGPAALPPDATAADTAPNEAAASTEGGQGASGASVSAEDPGQNQAAQVQGAQAAEGAGGQLAQPGGEAEPVPQVKGSANRATESGESGAVAGDAGSTGPAAAPAVPGAGSGVLTADSLAADFRGVLDRLNNDPNRSASIAQFLEKAGSLNSSGLKDLLGKLGIAERPKSKQDALDKMRMVLENQAAMRGKVEEIQGGGVLDLYQNAAKLSDADYQVGLSKVEQELEGASKSQLKNLWQQMGMVGKTSADAITDLIQKRRDAFTKTQLINPNKKRPGIMDWEPPTSKGKVQAAPEAMPRFDDTEAGRAAERAYRASLPEPDYNPGDNADPNRQPRILRSGSDYSLAPRGRAPKAADNAPGGGVSDVLAVPPAEAAQIGGNVIRHRNAELEQRRGIVGRALSAGKAYYQVHTEAAPDEATRNERFLQFTDAYEGGHIETLPEGGPREAAQAVKEANDAAEPLVKERGILKTFIKNYFGRALKDPRNPSATPEDLERKIYSSQSLQGPQGFRKRRDPSLITFRDVIEAGLEPATWNPVEMAEWKLDEKHRSIFGHDVFNEYKDAGLNKFVPLNKQAPAGWKAPKDKAWQVYAPPEVPIHEYYDEGQRKGLMDFANKLGIGVETTMHGQPGTATRETGNVTRRFATGNEVLAHEIGHQLGYRYDLAKEFGKDPLLAKEMRALADKRSEGQDPADWYKKYVRSGTEKEANLVAAYLHAPELMDEVAPNLHQAFDKFLRDHPELEALRKVKPSLVLGSDLMKLRLAGPMLTGRYFMPEVMADIVDRHLSPGLSGNKAFDMFRGFGNAMVMMRLGLSAFHGHFTALTSGVSRLASSLRMASQGDLQSAGLEAGKMAPGLGGAALGGAIAGPPGAAIGLMVGEGAARLSKGLKMRQEWYNPGSQPPEIAELVEQYKMGGGRIKGGAEHLGSALENLQKSLRQIQAGKYGEIPKAVRDAIPGLMQLGSKPIMEHWVPLIKASVFADQSAHELAKLGPDATVNQKREVLGKLVDSLDNRFGLMTYDNMFLSRAVKESLQATMQSAGWNIGTAREVGGGAMDLVKPATYKGLLEGKGISNRAAFLLALPVYHAVLGSMYQYMMTGEAPRDLKDMFFPRTGRKRDDGSDDRLSLPSYMKDLAGLFNRSSEGWQRVVRNAGTMAVHKLNPLISTTAQWFNNEDFYGRAITNPADDEIKQDKDSAMHFLKAFKPYALQGYEQQRETGATPGQAAQTFLGVTPAPAYLTRTAEQQQAQELKYSRPLQKKIAEEQGKVYHKGTRRR